MNTENVPVTNPVPASRWSLILTVLAAIAAGLLLGILVLQVLELQFYKAAPSVWP